MNTKTILLYGSCLLLVLSGVLFLNFSPPQNDFSSKVQSSLREVGHQLLLYNADSTSLVRPVLQRSPYHYQLEFQSALKIDPGVLASQFQKSLAKAKLPNSYRVEVIPCTTDAIAHSFIMNQDTKEDIVPCQGRILPSACYTVHLHFTELPNKADSIRYFTSALLILLGSFFALLFYLISIRREVKKEDKPANTNTISLGKYHFFPDQHKLHFQAQEVALSSKECELLALLANRPNEVITREELSKKVWEDKGVIVGRSLDTYISKLRKKLQLDQGIQIVNLHGVGYKLVIGKEG